MTNTWLLVANASKATIYAIDKKQFVKGKEKLTLVKELTHPESRKKDIELTSDRSGHYQARGGEGHGSFIESTDPKQYEAEVFAKEVVRELEAGRVKNQYNELILVVPPQFYGLLHQNLHHPLQQIIVKIIEKDYTKDPEKTLEQHLLKQLTAEK